MTFPDERRNARQQICIKGQFRKGIGLALAVDVVDLTSHGCQLENIPTNLRRQDIISIRIEGFGPITATVKWLEVGKKAGLEFQSPLHSAVFDHILAKHRAKASDSTLSRGLRALRAEPDKK